MASFKSVMGSRAVVALVRAGAALFLAVTMVAAGFAACLLPQTTEALANATVDTELSPFEHDDLVAGAVATRDYSFFGHDEHALLAQVYTMNQHLAASGYKFPAGVSKPLVEQNVDASSLSTDQLGDALYSANVAYVLDEEAVSHLDDVYNVAVAAYVALGIIAILCVAAIAHVVFYRGWRGAWGVFAVAGGGLLVLFAVLGIVAAIDFYGFFTAFHSLFFTGDSWVFPIDCLLICMLPEGFWMGMGAVWLAVTAVLAAASLAAGLVLRKKGAARLR